jgi:hypothetical protein
VLTGRDKQQSTEGEREGGRVRPLTRQLALRVCAQGTAVMPATAVTSIVVVAGAATVTMVVAITTRIAVDDGNFGGSGGNSLILSGGMMGLRKNYL